MSISPTVRFGPVKHEAPVTEFEARVTLAKMGFCPDHPDIKLEMAKGPLSWKKERKECHHCKEEFRLKTQCWLPRAGCPEHPGIIMTKSRRFECGIQIHHLVCPICARDEMFEGKTSKKVLPRNIDLLTTQYAELASDARIQCTEITRLQSELENLKDDLLSSNDVETDLLDRLLQKAIPKIEDLLALSERTAHPEPVEQIQAIRSSMMSLEARVKTCEGSSQQLIANAMQEVLQQLDSIRNDNRIMKIESEEQGTKGLSRRT